MSMSRVWVCWSSLVSAVPPWGISPSSFWSDLLIDDALLVNLVCDWLSVKYCMSDGCWYLLPDVSRMVLGFVHRFLVCFVLPTSQQFFVEWDEVLKLLSDVAVALFCELVAHLISLFSGFCRCSVSVQFWTSLNTYVIGSSVTKYLYFASGYWLWIVSVALMNDRHEFWSAAPWPDVLQFIQ